MVRRFGRAAAVGLTLLALTGCDRKQDQPRPTEPTYAGSTERAISRELSKYGPKISMVIDTDYTDGKDVPIKLRRSEKTYRQLALESGLPGIGINSPSGGRSSAALYDDLHKTIILLSPTHLKAFHHEFGHAIFPFMERITLPGYSGPNEQEILSMIAKRKKRMRANGIMDGIELVVRKASALGDRINTVKLAIAQFEKNRKVLQGLEQDEDKVWGLVKEAEGIAGRLQGIKSRIGRYQRDARMNQEKVMRFGGENVCLEDVKKVEAIVGEAESDLLKIEGDEVLDRMKELDERFARDLPGSYTRLQLNRDKVLRKQLAVRQTLESMEHACLSPSEVWARMVESLMRVYVEKECRDLYRLERDELELMEKMALNGEPVFSNAASKYRVALEMLQDGLDPAHIMKELEYAKSYIYKEREYIWQTVEVRIIGQIPKIDRLGQ